MHPLMAMASGALSPNLLIEPANHHDLAFRGFILQVQMALRVRLPDFILNYPVRLRLWRLKVLIIPPRVAETFFICPHKAIKYLPFLSPHVSVSRSNLHLDNSQCHATFSLGHILHNRLRLPCRSLYRRPVHRRKRRSPPLRTTTRFQMLMRFFSNRPCQISVLLGSNRRRKVVVYLKRRAPGIRSPK